MPRSLATTGAALQHIRRLFTEGGMAGLTDAELLDRFADGRDEVAFASLIGRHGPMVLATCRSVLRDVDDADDAFQATFLVLSRRAGSLRVVGGSVGDWLHGVALRVASRSRADRGRRRAREVTAGGPIEVAVLDDRARLEELLEAVHVELGRLPAKYREPVVLCVLEGRTHAQAAAELGRGEATVRRRLARARELLRSRLERRGIASAAVLVGLLGSSRASAAVPDALASATARAARSLALGRGAIGASGAAAALAGAVSRALDVVRYAAAGATGAASIAVGACVLLLALGEGPGVAAIAEHDAPPPAEFAPTPSPVEPPSPPRPKAPAVPGRPDEATVPIVGRVVGADGEPVAGARVTDRNGLLLRADLRPEPVSTGPDGQFVLHLPRASLEEKARTEPGSPIGLYAWAVGHAPIVVEVLPGPEAPGPVEIRLAADDATIEGRIIDLEGRPVAGATIRADRAFAPEGGDLGPWLEQARRESRPPTSLHGLPETVDRLIQLGMDSEATTDADGHFRLRGVGRGRIAKLTITGPDIASDVVYAITDDVSSFHVAFEDEFLPREDHTYHGSTFEHVAAPTKPIEGTVRDAETGEPIAGAWVGATLESARRNWSRDGVEATTDADGRYRLTGLPTIEPTDAFVVFVRPPEGLAYPMAQFEIRADSPALDPVPFDIELRRGIVVRGWVTDKATGAPVFAKINYYALAENPHLADYPGFVPSVESPWAPTDADGRFAVVALPGPGIITARSEVQGYLPGVGAPEIVARQEEEGFDFQTVPSGFYHVNYQSIAAIDPDPGAETIERDLPLDPGRTVSGSILDPDGEPLAGVEARFLDAFDYGQPRTLPTADFEARAVSPDHRRAAMFFHRGRDLSGTLPLRGDEAGPVAVGLVPAGAITGRVIDEEGAPVTDISVDDASTITDPTRSDPPPGDFTSGDIPVDADGRFRIEGLVPGLSYRGFAFRSRRVIQLGILFEGVTVGPGEQKDLGDLKILPTGD